ncbi:class II histone deacetylase [Fredinandcohnia onubensis]|uniref:class II histone deacetylase n=1 Tax=Fredinandcohnia onubensis TaxID=1571209 RepID=UPI000C0BEEB3|nr:class II histone deacetylase [Fredinandcohnia onubensis]
MSQKTAFICDESYFWHNPGNGALGHLPGGYIEPYIYAENPESKRRVKNLLERCGLINKLKLISPKDATQSEVEYYHTTNYIEKVKELSNTTGGDAGKSAIVGRGSYEIALKSVGGAITAVDKVMQGEVDNAYALTRPPGHHAESDIGIGFCIFNNIAIAALHAKRVYNLKRILILDWDVHHGNGTEKAFYSDSEVLYISLHQENYYPAGSGLVEHTGVDNGLGYNVNVPLPAGTGDVGYIYALEKVVKPIADRFKPELILLSAGQDASMFDPMGRMIVTAKGYGEMTSILMEIANKHCNGRLVAVHEGGYSASYVPFCTLSIIESLSGIDAEVVDPFVQGNHELPSVVTNDLKKSIERVINTQLNYWNI